MKLLFIDTETTGLDPERHTILQIAWCIEDLSGNIINHDDFYIRPDREDWRLADKEAISVNRLTEEKFNHLQSITKQEAYERIRLIRNKLDDDPNQNFWIGKNPEFDLNFIGSFLGHRGRNTFPWKRAIRNSCNHRLIDINPYIFILKHLGCVDTFDLKESAAFFGLFDERFPDKLNWHDAWTDIIVSRFIYHSFENIFRFRDLRIPKEDLVAIRNEVDKWPMLK